MAKKNDKKSVEREVFKAPNPDKGVKSLLKELCQLDAISGFEGEARTFIKKYIKDLGLKHQADNLGSVVGVKKGTGKGPRVLIAGHMDEIGFVVTKIEKSGFVKITPLGGWWSHVLLSQKMTILTQKGDKVHGVVGSTPPHVLSPAQRSKVLPLKDVYIDMGCKSKEDVIEAGVNLGDPVIPASEMFDGIDKNVVFAKAIDNRAGTAVALLLLKRLTEKKLKHFADVYSGATVQEEVGLRGARTLAYEINPDISIALDVTISSDHPGMDKTDGVLGNGVAISLLDGSVIGNPKLIRALEDVAKENKIAYSFDALTGGGTDAGAFHLSRSGVITVTLSIPTRYIHSHLAACHLGDIEAAVQLLEKFIVSLDEKMYQGLLHN